MAKKSKTFQMTTYPSKLEWRAIEGYEGIYEVSSNALVRSLPRVVGGEKRTYNLRGRQLAQWVDNHGYWMVTLGTKKSKRTIAVHRLVACAFINNPKGVTEVNHKNGIKTDNNLSNLEWVTHADNMRHAYDTGLNKRGTLVTLEHVDTQATFRFRSMSRASLFMGRDRSYLALRKLRGQSTADREWAVHLG